MSYLRALPCQSNIQENDSMTDLFQNDPGSQGFRLNQADLEQNPSCTKIKNHRLWNSINNPSVRISQLSNILRKQAQ